MPLLWPHPPIHTHPPPHMPPGHACPLGHKCPLWSRTPPPDTHAPPPATRAVKISGELGLKLNKESESDESEELDEFEICLLVEMWIVAEVIKELNSRTSPGDNSASNFAL